MVAKATNEPHASPVKLKRSTSKDVYEPWEMTERERELATKYIKLIQGRIPNKEPILLTDVSPGEDTIADISASMISSVISSSSQESVYASASDFLEQVTLLACPIAPVVAVVHASLHNIIFFLKIRWTKYDVQEDNIRLPRLFLVPGIIYYAYNLITIHAK